MIGDTPAMQGPTSREGSKVNAEGESPELDVKGCPWGYRVTDDNTVSCTYEEGHDRVRSTGSMNMTLFDHGNPNYNACWDEASRFAVPGNARIELSTEGIKAYNTAGDVTVDMVNHPVHYGGEDNPYEAIKVIEAWGLGFAIGNAVKYLCRAGSKGDRLEDLKKARWYLDREIKNLS